VSLGGDATVEETTEGSSSVICQATGKVMHTSRRDAKKACKAHKQIGEKKQPYLCVVENGCGQWHIGQMPQWQREGRECAPGQRTDA
jgi:hypothetical protein